MINESVFEINDRCTILISIQREDISFSGLHSYVFLVYKQQANIGKPALDSDKRGGWKVNDFATKHNMELVAGNFFLVGTYKFNFLLDAFMICGVSNFQAENK